MLKYASGNWKRICSKGKRQKRRNKWQNIYVESRKMAQMNLFAKQKQSHRCREQSYGHQGGTDKLGIWD